MPYCPSSAEADWLVVVSYQGIAPATPAVLATSIVFVAVRVLPSATVMVLPVAGPVTVTLLILVEDDSAVGRSTAPIQAEVTTWEASCFKAALPEALQVELPLAERSAF